MGEEKKNTQTVFAQHRLGKDVCWEEEKKGNGTIPGNTLTLFTGQQIIRAGKKKKRHYAY